MLAADAADAATRLAADAACSLALIDASEAEPFLAQAEALGLSLQALETIEGQNYSNGDEMQLTLYRAEP